jgi:hypothetical protein
LRWTPLRAMGPDRRGDGPAGKQQVMDAHARLIFSRSNLRFPRLMQYPPAPYSVAFLLHGKPIR